MAKVGYARVSSNIQSLERQLIALKHCSKVFKEKASGKNTNREQLNAMINYLREGDIVVITELDRLGRNNDDLTKIIATIRQKGATLEILSFPTFSGVEDTNLRGLLNNLILEIYKYQAENERKRIRERQSQGIEIAKQNGKYTGRKPKFSDFNDVNLRHALDLYISGSYSMNTVSKMTGISVSTFSRYFKKYKEHNPT